MIDWDNRENNLFLKWFVGLGFIFMIGIVALYNYLKNSEYPKLKTADLIENEWMESVEINRGLCYVELQNGFKFRVSGENYNYEDYSSIAQVVSSKVMFSKKVNSDTVTIKYDNKEYNFVIGKSIEKKF